VPAWTKLVAVSGFSKSCCVIKGRCSLSCKNEKSFKKSVENSKIPKQLTMMEVSAVLLKYEKKKLDAETHNAILKDLGFTLIEFPQY